MDDSDGHYGNSDGQQEKYKCTVCGEDTYGCDRCALHPRVSHCSVCQVEASFYGVTRCNEHPRVSKSHDDDEKEQNGCENHGSRDVYPPPTCEQCEIEECKKGKCNRAQCDRKDCTNT
jgi:hypothetical protein